MKKEVVNDIHSQLNPTTVLKVVEVTSVRQIQEVVQEARAMKVTVCISGGRHAMGSQQFGSNMILIDLRKMNKILSLDSQKGLVHLQAGIEWPKLIQSLITKQRGKKKQWSIIQKQTGGDNLTIGGCIGANAHGRVLTSKPFINDVESLVLVTPGAKVLTCSRKENQELFNLVVGGYGLFGVVASVTLRLMPRVKMRRVVEVLPLPQLMSSFQKRINDGFIYGDWQFTINGDNPNFLSLGIFSCYKPEPAYKGMPTGQRELSIEDWKKLLYLAHANKDKAYEVYRTHYLATSGQIYWSDLLQLSKYIDQYHLLVDKEEGTKGKATEIITEIYVPRNKIVPFMQHAKEYLSKNKINIIYGTVRLIQKDEESFLAWAKQDYVCIIFNIHTIHTPTEINRSAAAFRKLIDIAVNFGGSYFLTYHKYATKQQVLACYPQFPKFLKLKRKWDPQEVFQSNWYLHYQKMFNEEVKVP